MPTIYLAATLFTAFERERNIRLHSALDAHGVTLFLPQSISPTFKADGFDFHPVFAGCKDWIDGSDALVALVDGPEIDSGVAWELGYAYARTKPCLCIRTDFRGEGAHNLNVMIAHSATKFVSLTKYRISENQLVMEIADSVAEWLKDIK